MIRWRSIKLNHENYHTFPPGGNFNALATYNSNFTANGSAMTDSFRADSCQQPNVQLFLQAFVLIYLFETQIILVMTVTFYDVIGPWLSSLSYLGHILQS